MLVAAACAANCDGFAVLAADGHQPHAVRHAGLPLELTPQPAEKSPGAGVKKKKNTRVAVPNVIVERAKPRRPQASALVWSFLPIYVCSAVAKLGQSARAQRRLRRQACRHHRTPSAVARHAQVQAVAVTEAPTSGELDAVEETIRERFPFVFCRGVTSAVVVASERHAVAVGEQIIAQGEEGQRIYIIIQGSCQIESNGCEIGPGDIFGEIPLFTKALHTSSYVAQTDMILYSIPYDVVEYEVGRRRKLDPYGLKADVKRHLEFHGVSLAPDQVYDDSPEDMFKSRLGKLKRNVMATPWHGVCGAYVMLSTVVAVALLPFSPTSVPAWWIGSFVLASAVNALSAGTPGRRFAVGGVGDAAGVFDTGIACQLFFCYMIVRFSWNNMGLTVPAYLEGPWIHMLDLAIAIASIVLGVKWEGIRDTNSTITLGNIAQLITPLCWVIFFLKPAWVDATLADNTVYNILLSFMIQVGANAGTYFTTTLYLRGFINRWWSIAWINFFVWGGGNYFIVPAVVCNWQIPFDLLTLKGWPDYPFLGW